jgi:hypothetical protein
MVPEERLGHDPRLHSAGLTLTYLKQVLNQSIVLAMSKKLISPETTSIKTSFEE